MPNRSASESGADLRDRALLRHSRGARTVGAFATANRRAAQTRCECMRVLPAVLCLPGFTKVQFDIMAMTGYPEVNFPSADHPPSGSYLSLRNHAFGGLIHNPTDSGINLLVRLATKNRTDPRGRTEDSVGKVSRHRVLVAGIFSPLLALVLNVICIQALLALSSNPENNWRFRLFISSLALPIPFLATLVLALKDRRRAGLSLSAKIGLGIAALSLLLIAKPVMDGLARSKQSRNMAMHDVPAPMFDSFDIQGKPQRLADYKGKVVLVNIWATWCEPCRHEMPQLDKLYQSRKGGGFIVLGMSDETIAKQQAFVRQVPVTYPLLTITPGVPPFYREIARYPAIFLIDREGRLHPSPNESQGFGNVEEAVDSLLSGRK